MWICQKSILGWRSEQGLKDYFHRGVQRTDGEPPHTLQQHSPEAQYQQNQRAVLDQNGSYIRCYRF